MELLQAFIRYFPIKAENCGFKLFGGIRSLGMRWDVSIVSVRSISIFCYGERFDFVLVDLILQYFKFTDITFQQLGDLFAGNLIGRYNFFKIVEKCKEQFDGIRVGIGTFGTNIVANLAQSLQVDFGNFIILPYGLAD